MSEFSCPVVRIEKVLPHPNADRLDLVYFRDFAVISQKGLSRLLPTRQHHSRLYVTSRFL